MQSFITASLSRADRMRCVPERRFRTDESLQENICIIMMNSKFHCPGKLE